MTNNKDQLDTFEPAAELAITEVETLKVISDALRGRILDRLRAEPLTVKQLAAELELSPKKLYYHINLMEKHGLIRVVRTRLVSGIMEKTYRATAYLFLFEDPVFASKSSEHNLPPGISLLFETTRNQLEQSVENGQVGLETNAPEHRLLIRWNLSRIRPEQAAAFYKRLEALLDDFAAAESDAADETAQSYRLFLTLFPVRGHRRGQHSG